MPAFAATKVLDIIERELGAPVGALFASFDERPLAAASLGQVRVPQEPCTIGDRVPLLWPDPHVCSVLHAYVCSVSHA